MSQLFLILSPIINYKIITINIFNIFNIFIFE